MLLSPVIETHKSKQQNVRGWCCDAYRHNTRTPGMFLNHVVLYASSLLSDD